MAPKISPIMLDNKTSSFFLRFQGILSSGHVRGRASSHKERQFGNLCCLFLVMSIWYVSKKKKKQPTTEILQKTEE